MLIASPLANLLCAFPDLKVDLKLSDTIVDLVEGGFDIAIRNSELKDSTLVARKIATDTRVLCASPDYLKIYGKPESPAELLNHECISLMGLET